METIKLFFFATKLLLANTLFLIKYAWARSPLTVTFIFASLLFFLHISLVILAAQTSQLWQQTVSYYFQDVDTYQQEQRQAEIKLWEERLETYPTHRDVLLKLALLHCQNNDQETCQKYWQQAAEIDPNHQAVIEFQHQFLSN